MSPFGPAFVILPTRTLPTLLDEPRQLDELAENIGLASQELWKFKSAPHPDRYMCPNLPVFYASLGSSQYSCPSLPGFRHPLASRPPLLRTNIGRGGNPLGLRIDLNVGLGALA
jgi:hypothetical protein